MIRKQLFLSALITLAASCQPNSGKKENTLAGIKDQKVLQYAIEGKVLYDNYCANCHQKNGEGLGTLIPPLNGSDYMSADVGRTIRIIKYGMEGEIIVNGVTYDRPMPGNPQLSNLELAQISTYIFNIWGNDTGIIEPKKVAFYLKE